MKILIFYDVPGWAWWHKAQAIQRHMPPDIQVDVMAYGSEFNQDEYAFLILFGSYMLDLPVPVPAEKLILGLSNNGPWYVDSVRRLYLEGRVRAIFANSELGRELLNVNEAFCCQNGVDADFFCPPVAKPHDFSVGWVGNPSSDVDKGLDLIRAACSTAGLELLSIEHDATKGDLSGIRGQKHLRDNIYWQVSCYVCASRYDGTPNPALEAMACGLPVISTQVGNMPEIIRNGVNGFLIERNAEAIIQGLEWLVRSDLGVLGRAARQIILDGWTWPQKVKTYEAMIRSLTNRND